MRNTRLFSKGRRGSLPAGCESWLNFPDHLKRILLNLDPALEIIHYKKGYYVYRVFAKGGVPSDDLLIKEFKLKAPPGAWLIEHLAAHDSYKRRGDKMKNYWEGVKNYDFLQEKKHESKLDDMIHSLTGDLLRKAVDRKVFDVCLQA